MEIVLPDNHFCEQDQNEENEVPGRITNMKSAQWREIVLLVEWSFYRRELILRNLWVEADFCLGASVDASCVNFSCVLKKVSQCVYTHVVSDSDCDYVYVLQCYIKTLRSVPANRRLSLLSAQTSVSSPSLKWKLSSWNKVDKPKPEERQQRQQQQL